MGLPPRVRDIEVYWCRASWTGQLFKGNERGQATLPDLEVNEELSLRRCFLSRGELEQLMPQGFEILNFSLPVAYK